jgi:hypothetical protein
MPRFAKTPLWARGASGVDIGCTSVSDPGSETEEEDSSTEDDCYPQDITGPGNKRVPYGPTCVHDNAYPAPDSFKESDPERIHRPDFTEQYMGMCSDDVVNAMFTDGHGRCGLGFLLRAIKERAFP